jgi:hypothetical protein
MEYLRITLVEMQPETFYLFNESIVPHSVLEVDQYQELTARWPILFPV